MKYVIFDAGSVISLTMNGLLGILEKLKEGFDGEFILTPQVKNELVDKPSKIKKYEFESIQVKALIKKGVFKMSSKIVSDSNLRREINKIIKISNSAYVAFHEKVKIIQEGETSCLAFAKLCGADNVIVTDERTVRLLTEKPENISRLMENKMHTKVSFNKKEIKYFSGFRFIRSAELLYVAYKKGLFEYKDSNLLGALLYAVKFKGAAISSDEISEMKLLARE
jgi:predicted nucleic acid-binding protein